MSVRLSSAEDYAALLDRYDTWMFDCDGVLWHGDRLIDGVVEVLKLLRRKSKGLINLIIQGLTTREEKKVLFVTNNATKSRKNYKGKFDQLGVDAHVVSGFDFLAVYGKEGLSLMSDNRTTKDEIYGSAYAAAVYLSSVIKLAKTKKVYVIGMAGLEEELTEEGIEHLGGSVSNPYTSQPLNSIPIADRTQRTAPLPLSHSQTSRSTPMWAPSFAG
jgi:4-nitrophenyl phosphatase